MVESGSTPARWRYRLAAGLAALALAALAIFPGPQRSVALVVVVASAAAMVGAAAGRIRRDGAGAARAAAGVGRLAARARQSEPTGRADALGGAVARPRRRGPGRADAGRFQPARAIGPRVARRDAEFLFPRRAQRRGRRLPPLSRRSGAASEDRRSADDARPHRPLARHARRRGQSQGERRLGARGRPRRHFRREPAGRLEESSPANGGAPTTAGRRWCRWRPASPTGSASSSATR